MQAQPMSQWWYMPGHDRKLLVSAATATGEVQTVMCVNEKTVYAALSQKPHVLIALLATSLTLLPLVFAVSGAWRGNYGVNLIEVEYYS